MNITVRKYILRLYSILSYCNSTNFGSSMSVGLQLSSRGGAPISWPHKCSPRFRMFAVPCFSRPQPALAAAMNLGNADQSKNMNHKVINLWKKFVIEDARVTE